MNAPPLPDPEAKARTARAGLLYGLAAYGLWGVLPIYFKSVKAVPPIDIVAHRIVWSLAVLALFLTVAKAWGAVKAAITNWCAKPRVPCAARRRRRPPLRPCWRR